MSSKKKRGGAGSGRKVRSRRQVIRALIRWKFIEDPSHHHIVYFHLVGADTMLPHSKHVKNFGAGLLKKIANDIQLSLVDFIELIDDKKSTESDYLKRRKV